MQVKLAFTLKLTVTLLHHLSRQSSTDQYCWLTLLQHTCFFNTAKLSRTAHLCCCWSTAHQLLVYLLTAAHESLVNPSLLTSVAHPLHCSSIFLFICSSSLLLVIVSISAQIYVHINHQSQLLNTCWVIKSTHHFSSSLVNLQSAYYCCSRSHMSTCLLREYIHYCYISQAIQGVCLYTAHAKMSRSLLCSCQDFKDMLYVTLNTCLLRLS